MEKEKKEKKLILEKVFFKDTSSYVIWVIAAVLSTVLSKTFLWLLKARIDFSDFPIWLCLAFVSTVMAITGCVLRNNENYYYNTGGNIINKVMIALAVVFSGVLIAGSIGSGPMFQAKNLYNEVAPFVETIGERNASNAFPDLLGKNNDTSNLPLIGDAEAIKKAETEMGKYPALGSQFGLHKEELTSQNINGKLCYVIPLQPSDCFKWNSSEGAPGFFIIDRNSGEVEYIEKAYFSTTSAPFGDNTYRVVNSYLDRMGISGLTTDASPEVDDNKNLHFITTVYHFKGVCGGYRQIDGVVDMNAHTKECSYYPLDKIPSWIDRVVPEDFFVTYLKDYGNYKGGFLNSIFGKKGVQTITEDSESPEIGSEENTYNSSSAADYDVIYIDGICYYYTGWTSVGKEGASNGIMMMNSRDASIRYYPTYGVSEGKAQDVVEGLVADKGYESTYPLLLKVAGEETYFHLMRDKNENLVGYAFCNYKDHTKAAYATSIDEAEAAYIKALGKENDSDSLDESTLAKVKGKISDVRDEVVDGNTIYYVKVEGVNQIFSAYSKVNIDLVFANIGDSIEIEYYESDSSIEAIKKCSIS